MPEDGIWDLIRRLKC